MFSLVFDIRTAAAAIGAFMGVALTALLLAGSASAASTTYVGGTGTTFGTSAGGWTHADTYEGVCIQGVTCPSISGSHVNSGGTGGAGDGFIRTDSGSTSLLALLSNSIGTWTSPDFTYSGAAGKAPDELAFTMSKRSDFGALLALGADVSLSVMALNKSGGSDLTLIESGSPGADEAWTSVGGNISPTAMTVGSKYAIQITVSVGGLAAVLPAGGIDLDDVALVASKSEGGNGGGGNGGGNGGGGNGGGGNGGGNGAVKPPPAVIPPGQGYFHRGKLFVRVKCPKRFKPRCRIRAVVLTKRRNGKAMTRRVNVNVKSKRFVRKALVVKPKFRKRMRKLAKVNHKTITLRLRIKSKRGKKKGTRLHNLKVLQRR
ncbi:MAG: hypothetical protein M3Y45_00690 [Actinomycetota bacterium]|nr:hypothetical protein [Actinomycetota bacterium]